MAEWKIHKREEGCSACRRPFEEDESHYSILLVTPETFGREDLCRACFDDSDRSGEVVFWRTRRRGDARRGLAVDFESIERLFLALEGQTEERLAELRYLLSLLLMRKKRLKLVRVKRTADAEFMLLRRPRRTEELAVRVFDLTPDRTAILRTELERIFEGSSAEDLLAPPTVPAPDAASTPDETAEPPAAGDPVGAGEAETGPKLTAEPTA